MDDIMTVDLEEENVFTKRPPLTFHRAVLTTIYHLLLDIVVYGCFVPLVGIYTGGSIAQMSGISPVYELLLVVIISFSSMYAVLTIIGEPTYWVELFAYDPFYSYLLIARDMVNVLFTVMCMVSLAVSVESMIFKDKGMKRQYISEWVGYVFLKTVFCDYLRVDPSFLLHLGVKFPPHSTDSRSGEMENYENAAIWILNWAMLTCCIAKLVYFNTLATYLRAVEMFINMKPAFGIYKIKEKKKDGDEIRRNRSGVTVNGRESTHSRLEDIIDRSLIESRYMD